MYHSEKPLNFAACQQTIEQEISTCINLKDRKPENLYAPVEYILSIGGKRFRPALLLMACNLFTDSCQHAIKPALAIEVFHNFTLLHDDIMDKAEMRRGNLTVHKKWDENIAILSGDAMSILAYELLCDVENKYLPRILSVFNQTALEVCNGQQYDMDFEERQDVSIADYLHMITLKTSVLIAGSLKIGAILGGATDRDANLMYDFGLNLGLSFQLQDDYLDTFGDEAKFGKNIGGDIVANKKTYLLLKAFELANENQKIQLQNLVNAKSFNRKVKIAGVKNIFSELKVADYAKAKMEEYYLQSLSSLDAVSVDSGRKEELRKFATMMMNREA
jgi:geranylgeranyl diphosphate synthase type II